MQLYGFRSLVRILFHKQKPLAKENQSRYFIQLYFQLMTFIVSIIMLQFTASYFYSKMKLFTQSIFPHQEKNVRGVDFFKKNLKF
jgi:hypothetical protein